MTLIFNNTSKFLYILFFFFEFSSVQGQNITEIAKMPDDTNKLNSYLVMLSHSRPENYLDYANLAVDLADNLIPQFKSPAIKQSLYYKKIRLYGYLNYYYYYTYYESDSLEFAAKKRIEIQQKAIKLAEAVKDNDRINLEIGALCDLFISINLYTKAMDTYVDRLKRVEYSNDMKSVVFCLRNISDIYLKIKNYKKALEYELKAFDALKKTKTDSTQLFTGITRVGDKYQKNSEFDASILQYKKAYSLLKSTSTNRDKHSVLLKMAKSFIGLKEYESARRCLFAGLEIPVELEWFDNEGNSHISKDSSVVGQIYNEVGQIYFYENNFSKALEFKLKGISLLESNLSWEKPTDAYLVTAQVYFKMGQYDLAERYAIKAKNNAIKDFDLYNQMEISKLISNVYNAKGDKRKSDKSLIEYYKIKDSISKAANAEDIMFKELNYENEKKEAQLLAQQEKRELLHQQENKKQRIVTYSVVAGLILICFFLVFVFLNLKKSRRANQIIAQQKFEVETQKHLVEEKQKEILDSITYAKRLQEAILPPNEFVNSNLTDNFIYYQPKDIVAGDFYWAEKADDMFFIAAADSTGHGVPGALVSVVCSNALNRALKEFKLTETGKILDKTRELVIETFEKSASEVKDGMDISLLCIDSKNKNIYWSGANNPLWYIQDSELKEIKADKQPIGKSDYLKPFTTHQIEFKENTTFYLFTDGLADQFGGPNGKKFKYKQFSDLLIKNNNLTQKQQADIINKAFCDWKGDLEQVDDVCVIGIKI